MKMLTGAILLLIAELSFAHTHLIQFPHHLYVSEFLIPSSVVAGILGALLLIWGIVDDVRIKRSSSSQSDTSSKHV